MSKHIHQSGLSFLRQGVAIVSVLLVAGCASFGPRTIQTQQADYAAAIREAGKRQLLQNIVALRFGDIPSYVRVNQIVAGYEQRYAGSLGTALTPNFDIDADFQAHGEGSFANRPTFTLQPLQGAEYARIMLRPVPPADIMALAAGGGNIDTLFRLAVKRVNGVPNDEAQGAGAFTTLIDQMTRLRDGGGLLIETPETGEGASPRVHVGLSDAGAEGSAARVRGLLGLPPGDSYPLSPARARPEPGVIYMQTRSLSEIMTQAGLGIGAADRRGAVPQAVGGDLRNVIHIRSGSLPPGRRAYARTSYAGETYWIEEDDVESKRVFAMLLLLSTIMEEDGTSLGTMLVIPTN
ncbi:hypothetical protein LCM08_17765 [Salipiger pacificus]|nr:hypothetical protein [Alloyangia pacifica]